MRRTANGPEVHSDSIQKPCVGYSFFSDIEHEASVVACGHRATLTCSLYFIPEAQGLLVAPLCDPAIQPNSVYPAFGLRCQTDGIDCNDCLKRIDAAHGRVLTSIVAVWNVLVFYLNVGSYNDYIEEEGPVVEQLQKYGSDDKMGASPQLVEFASTDSLYSPIRPRLTHTGKSVCDKATKDAGHKI
ncbi:hypothetical protein EDC04DRAFT_2839907 [Pisolithus marmoratus]|nr:hypothetical protein EDC04DRAFT_2839907 [Pisolithus marmoratus]